MGAAHVDEGCARAEVGPRIAFHEGVDGGRALLYGHCSAETLEARWISGEMGEEMLICAVS